MSNAPEFGQGEGTLSRAAGLVTDARADFNKIADKLSGQIAGVQGKWGGQGASAFFILHRPGTRSRRSSSTRSTSSPPRCTATERDNVEHRRRAERVLHQAQRPPRLTGPQDKETDHEPRRNPRQARAHSTRPRQDMYQTVKDIDDRMNRLESELAPLKSDWHGNAQQAYTTGQGQVGLGDPGDARPARREPPDRLPVERRVPGRRQARRRSVRDLSDPHDAIARGDRRTWCRSLRHFTARGSAMREAACKPCDGQFAGISGEQR